MSKSKTVEGLATELGNQIIEDLIQAGWKKIHEYSPLAFDLGLLTPT